MRGPAAGPRLRRPGDRARRRRRASSTRPVDLEALPWPDSTAWLGAARRQPAGRRAVTRADPRPLRLEGTRLYLDRYWRRSWPSPPACVDRGRAPARRSTRRSSPPGSTGCSRPDGDDLQRPAAAAAVRCGFAVVAGGPGTGKTTTVARIVALLDEQAAAAGAATARRPRRADGQGRRPAPGGGARRGRPMAIDAGGPGPAPRHRRPSTLHRLLGWRPGSRSRFRHDRRNRLPHDVVIVDETSMVSLSTDGRPRRGRRPRRPAGPRRRPRPAGLRRGRRRARRHRRAGRSGRADRRRRPRSPTGIVVLRNVHRFGGAIAELAAAIQRGDVDAASTCSADGSGDVDWIVDEAPPTATSPPLAGRSATRRRRRPTDHRCGRGRRCPRRARRAARGAGPVRPPPRAVRRHRLDEPGRAVARRGDRRLRRRRAVVRRPAAARHDERARAAPLQR